MTFFYLSFCDASLPEGEQFLGATIVESTNAKNAVMRAWKLGINPGGEAAIVPMDALNDAARKYLNRFVPRDEVLKEKVTPIKDL